MHGDKITINWNKDLKWESKQAFVDAHKEAYPTVDLGAEYDKHFAKAAKAEPAKGSEPTK